MKNGKLVTDYLDACARDQAAIRSDDLEQLRAANKRLEDGVTESLWRACLADGWTIAEMDDAFYRRFNYRVNRG